MKIEHNGTLIRIYVAQSRRRERTDAYRLVVEVLAEAGIAGATVFFGIEGFGSGRRISNADSVDTFVDLPVLIEAVDEDSKIRAVMPRLESIIDDGLVTLERLQTIFRRYGVKAE
jgi:PII-like signaling protein